MSNRPGPAFAAPGVALYHGDALAVLPTLPAGSADCVVTDPPWMDYVTGRYDASGWHRPIGYVAPEQYAGELFRVLAHDSAAVVWCRWDCFQRHADAMTAAGFDVKNCIVWGKPNHTAGDLDGNLGNQHEMAVFAVKGRWARHGGRDVNLWNESHLFSRAARDHPTEKPVNLMERAVRNFCRPGGTVLDPFMGSGTTGVACGRTRREFIGIEIDAGYFGIARCRVGGEEAASAGDGPAQLTLWQGGAK